MGSAAKRRAQRRTTAADGGRPRSGRRWAAGLLAALVVSGAAVSACTNSNENSAAGDAASFGNDSAESGPAGGATEQERAAGTVGAAAPSAASSAGAAASAAAESGSAGSAAGDSADGGSGAAKGGSKAPATTDPEPVAMDGRQIIRTASFAVEVTVPATKDSDADQKALRQKVSELAIKARAAGTGVGGYVSASEGEGTTQSITLRVPVSKYDAARRALAGLGELTGTESSEDVTGALADMDGRIATMKAAVGRLRQLLTKATKISDIIAIESELSGREADLEAIMRKRAAMADQVALSTITLVISGKVVAATEKSNPALVLPVAQLGSPGPSGFVGGVLGAITVLKNIGAGMAVVFGALLPFLPILILLAFATPWLRRRFGELRRDRSPGAGLRPELRGDR
ncbi:DUF4349 domain-containing protein [Nakamurella lactea]|uniref:DUF4349 domain-containing protein n=1 Tax=Nakamurella lactea TaxID=459515 RepID=UPI00040257BE|nr:DUF4349 domain-containing protein [Nakamurella lactea]